MSYHIKESKVSRLSARLNLMVVLVLGLMLSTVLLACQNFYALRHMQREVVPYACNRGYIISDTAVDSHYLDLMAENFIYSRLNLTPHNVTRNYNELLQYVDSSFYAPFKKRLAKEEAVIKSKKISSHFDITNVESEPHQLISTITGELKRTVGYRPLMTAKKTYKIQYQYHQGQLTIVGFTQEKGADDA